MTSKQQSNELASSFKDDGNHAEGNSSYTETTTLPPEGLHSTANISTSASSRKRNRPNRINDTLVIDDDTIINRNNDNSNDSKNSSNNSYGSNRKKIKKQQSKKKRISHLNPIFQATSSSNLSSNAGSATAKLIISQLKDLYKDAVMPIEKKWNLSRFCLPTDRVLEDAEFDAKPMVLLIGQYSTGKSTFVRHLVGGDYPGMHIGPEPTTDKFMALVHGEDEEDDKDSNNETACVEGRDDNATLNGNKIIRNGWEKDGTNTSTTGKIIKGNSLTVTPELPFSGLSSFGSGFLSSFVGSVSNAPLLKHVTLIDTPGVLSGEKQRLSRPYDFAQAAKWFADRSDLILLLFDAHKLDISDELKHVIETICPQNDDRIRCILNKADGVTREQLVRVYGSLMWSLGKIFNSPEVVRVYTGSYWCEPLLRDDFQNMFESDESLLIQELINLPKSCTERKVNEMVKRIRMIKVHVCILTHLKKKMPRWFGKQNAKECLLQDLDKVFDDVRFEYKLSKGDMPDIKEFAKRLKIEEDFSSFSSADKKTLCILDDLILHQIPAIMKGNVGITNSSS